MRLEAPHAGHRLQLKPANMHGAVDDEQEARRVAAAYGADPTAAAAAGDDAARAALRRNARTLGLTLADLGLEVSPAAPEEKQAEGEEEGGEGGEGGGGAAEGPPRQGFCLNGSHASDHLDAALRAATRDALAAARRLGGVDDDSGDATLEAAEAAHGALAVALLPSAEAAAEEVEAKAEAKEVQGKWEAATPMAPDVRVRHGALGHRAAEAARAVAGAASVREAQAGLGGLREVLLDEARRSCGSNLLRLAHPSPFAHARPLLRSSTAPRTRRPAWAARCSARARTRYASASRSASPTWPRAATPPRSRAPRRCDLPRPPLRLLASHAP